ncbi:hypothetical protein Tco_0898952 [Tanacetum coccineum]
MFKPTSLAELDGLYKLQESQLNVVKQKGKMPLLPTPSQYSMVEATEWDSLLLEFDDVFSVPTSLPPNRSHDHRILLKTGTQPINVRPYRHPPT